MFIQTIVVSVYEYVCKQKKTTLIMYSVWSKPAVPHVSQGALWSWKVMENDDNVMEFLLLHWAIL